MKPEQLLRDLEKKSPAPVYLFVGPETYRRRACRAALLDRVLPDIAAREEGVATHDLDELTLAEVLDDARSMSLFAADRVLFIHGAESAVPRTDTKDNPAQEALKAYCADPTPGVTVVFDARRFDFDGEDKFRMERVLKFYAPVPAIVEFARFSPQDARVFAQSLASERGLRIGNDDLDALVVATAADPLRLANEIEKLALHGGPITAREIADMVPNASETTIFALVNALATRNRAQSLELLDRLVRAGEYLPLALTFLGGIFRLALAAREQGLRSTQDVQSFFQKQGMAMWRARAEQIYTASQRFSKEKLEEGIGLVFRADRDLKSSRADDRVVMEEFVLRLTR
jgi:DNA polymerase III subunit delta